MIVKDYSDIIVECYSSITQNYTEYWVYIKRDSQKGEKLTAVFDRKESREVEVQLAVLNRRAKTIKEEGLHVCSFCYRAKPKAAFQGKILNAPMCLGCYGHPKKHHRQVWELYDARP